MRGPSIGRQPPVTERFTFQLPVDQSRQLRAIAAGRRMAVATLVREIVIRELDKLAADEPEPEE